MNFLRLNNFEVPVQVDSVSSQINRVGRTSRSANSQYSSSTTYKKRTFSATTVPLPMDEAYAIEQLILGSGTHTTLSDGIHSSGGVCPSFSVQNNIPKPDITIKNNGVAPIGAYCNFGTNTANCVAGKILLDVDLRGDFDQTGSGEFARLRVQGYSIPLTDATSFPDSGYEHMTDNVSSYFPAIRDLDVTAIIGRRTSFDISAWGSASAGSFATTEARFTFKSPLLNGGADQVYTLTNFYNDNTVTQSVSLTGRNASAVYCNQTLFGENDWTILAYHWPAAPSEWFGVAGVGSGQTIDAYYRYGTGYSGLQPTATDFYDFFSVMGGPWGDMIVGSGGAGYRLSDVTFLPYKATPEMIAVWKDIRTQGTHIYPFSPLPNLYLSGDVLQEGSTPSTPRPQIEVYGTVEDAEYIQGHYNGTWHDNLVTLSFSLDEV
tara:strand:- start:5747 stop:7045 length:1299 start_codon:yes stop_codon:yes gene_type:complete